MFQAIIHYHNNPEASTTILTVLLAVTAGWDIVTWVPAADICIVLLVFPVLSATPEAAPGVRGGPLLLGPPGVKTWPLLEPPGVRGMLSIPWAPGV